METTNNIKINDIHDTMGDVSRKLEKIIALVDQLNEDFFERREIPSLKAINSIINKPSGVLTTEEENLSYGWIVNYTRIQSFFEIIEDYTRTSKDALESARTLILDAKGQE